jgi:hypothetical protein
MWGGAELGTEFVELEDLWGEVVHEGIVSLVGMRSKTVRGSEQRCPRRCKAHGRCRLGTCPERGVERRSVQGAAVFVDEGGGITPAGKHVLTGLATETMDIPLLTVAPIGNERVKRGVNAAKIRAGGVEAGVTMSGTALGTSAVGFPGGVGRRCRARECCVVVSSTQRTVVRRLGFGNLALVPATTNMSDRVAQRFARGIRCEERAEREPEGAKTPQKQTCGGYLAHLREKLRFTPPGDSRDVDRRVWETR